MYPTLINNIGVVAKVICLEVQGISYGIDKQDNRKMVEWMDTIILLYCCIAKSSHVVGGCNGLLVNKFVCFSL